MVVVAVDGALAEAETVDDLAVVGVAEVDDVIAGGEDEEGILALALVLAFTGVLATDGVDPPTSVWPPMVTLRWRLAVRG